MRSIVRRGASLLLAMVVVCAVARPGEACVADCRGEGQVTIDDLIRAVNIALGTAPTSDCAAADRSGDGAVTIDDLVAAVRGALEGCALGAAGEVLISDYNLQLNEFDLGTGAATTVVPPTHAQVFGQACLLPGGSGQFVVGDETRTSRGEPQIPRWSIFSPDGTLLKELPEPLGPRAGEPVGCAVDVEGRLYVTAAGGPSSSGRLVVFFPPDYSTSCILDSLNFPTQLAIDDSGGVYVPVVDVSGEPIAKVQRFASPFPSSEGECGSVVPTKSTFITQDNAIGLSLGIARRPNGHWFVTVREGSGSGNGGIREYGPDGAYLRDLFPLGDGGHPQQLAFDSEGTLFYSDDITTNDNGVVRSHWTLRKIAFDASGNPSSPEVFARGDGPATGLAIFPSRADEWLTLGGGLRRTYFNPRERQVNVDTVSKLTLKWRYLTSGLISAQPAVVWLDLPGEGRTQVIIVPSWDNKVYALRAENGTRVWQYPMKRQPGASYPYAASPTIAWIDGQPRVFVPGGETMYCLDAVSGSKIWQFDAGTGCTDCTARQERNEIEATPAVIDGLVIAAMDTNDGVPGKGGMFALRADDGRLVWWLDVFTRQTCRPLPGDEVHQFDGFHSTEELGLAADFFTTRPGCDFDRTSTACGNVWSSPAVDARRRLLYTVSANCDVDDDPTTPAPPPPPPPFEEAIFAVTLDGEAVWSWRPREVDPDDFDFGAVPNLFEAEIGGQMRDLVGVGGKDGTYYVLDRDGVNQITGRIEPYWQTNVVPGGPAGGMIGAASVGEGIIAVATAPGFSPFDPQKPAVHAFNPSTGEIVWQYSDVDPAFGPTMGVPGLVIAGGTPRPNLNFFTRADGQLLRPMPASTVPGGIAGGATIVGSMVIVGGGTGAFNEGSQAEGEARRDTPVSAFCVRETPGCEPNTCDDGDRCTYDYRNRSGTCTTEPAADGIDCTIPGGTTKGRCESGNCVQLEPTPVP